MPQKRVTAAGAVYWVGRVRGPDGRERSRSFPTRRAAKSWEDDQRTSMRAGTWIDPQASTVTVADLAAAWTAQATSEGTRRIRAQVERNLGDLADMRAAAVSPPAIRAWLGVLRDGRPWAGGRPVGAAMQSTLFNQLKAMLHQAAVDRVIPASPAARITVPRPSTPVTWADVPSASTIRKLQRVLRNGAVESAEAMRARGSTRPLRSLPNADAAVAVAVIAATGMRTSEACGLTWLNVDLDGGQVHVVAQADRRGAGLHALKTRSAGMRTITIDAGTVEVLRAHRRVHPGEERVLLQRNGAPMVACSLARLVRRAGVIAGLGEWTPKSLRHFHATALLRAGVPVKTVQARLGHASAKMTLDTYAHVIPADDVSASAAIAAALAGEGNVRGHRRGLHAVGG